MNILFFLPNDFSIQINDIFISYYFGSCKIVIFLILSFRLHLQDGIQHFFLGEAVNNIRALFQYMCICIFVNIHKHIFVYTYVCVSMS